MLSSRATSRYVIIEMIGASTGIETLKIRKMLLIVFRPVTGSMLIKWAMCISDLVWNMLKWPYRANVDLYSSKSVGKKPSYLSRFLSCLIFSLLSSEMSL